MFHDSQSLQNKILYLSYHHKIYNQILDTSITIQNQSFLQYLSRQNRRINPTVNVVIVYI